MPKRITNTNTPYILFHEIEREGILLNSFCEASITHPKSGQQHNKKENEKENAKILNEIMAN
jgi:hypothetical protein